MRYANPQYRMVGLLLPLVLATAGCGKKDFTRGDIRGEVKLDGQLLDSGSILFLPIERTQGTATGGKIAKGLYQLSGAAAPAVGQYRVEIRSMRKTGKTIRKPYAKSNEMVDEEVEAVPPRFNSASILKAEVKSGENTADFEVASK
jgi:hypothetical protein